MSPPCWSRDQHFAAPGSEEALQVVHNAQEAEFCAYIFLTTGTHVSIFLVKSRHRVPQLAEAIPIGHRQSLLPQHVAQLTCIGGASLMSDNVGLRADILDDRSIMGKPFAIKLHVERRPRVRKPLPWCFPFPPACVRIRYLCRLARRIRPFLSIVDWS